MFAVSDGWCGFDVPRWVALIIYTSFARYNHLVISTRCLLTIQIGVCDIRSPNIIIIRSNNLWTIRFFHVIHNSMNSFGATRSLSFALLKHAFVLRYIFYCFVPQFVVENIFNKYCSIPSCTVAIVYLDVFVTSRVEVGWRMMRGVFGPHVGRFLKGGLSYDRLQCVNVIYTTLRVQNFK